MRSKQTSVATATGEQHRRAKTHEPEQAMVERAATGDLQIQRASRKIDRRIRRSKRPPSLIVASGGSDTLSFGRTSRNGSCVAAITWRRFAPATHLENRDRLTNRSIGERDLRSLGEVEIQRSERAHKGVTRHATGIGDPRDSVVRERRVERLRDEPTVRPLIQHVRRDDDVVPAGISARGFANREPDRSASALRFARRSPVRNGARPRSSRTRRR